MMMKRLIAILVISVTSFCNISSQINYSGTYGYGTTAEQGSIGVLYIYSINDTTHFFHIEVNRGKPSYNSGELSGLIRSHNDKWVYVAQEKWLNCILHFSFLPTKIEISNANESCNCGFGHGVRANGIYYLRNDTIPEFYIDRHGDSININNAVDLILDSL